MVWCDKCKWGSSKVELTDEEWDSMYKAMLENAKKQVEEQYKDILSLLSSEQASQFIESKAKELVPYKAKDEWIEAKQKEMETLKKYYKMVVYCKKKHVLVVANPDNPTQIVDMSKECPDFEERA